jgi:predicted NBD/HSP70 family sugar kinase
VAENPEYILGIDLGATQLRFILAREKTGALDVVHGKNSKISFPSPLSEDDQVFSDSFFSQIPDSNKVPAYVVRKLESYLTELGVTKRSIKGIGVSVAGSVNRDGWFIGSNVPLRYAKKIENSYRVDLITNLKGIFPDGMTIIVENDGNCAGVAQGIYYEQMGLDQSKTFFITVSTGIGGGGPKRDLDEVGHIIVDGYFPGLVPVCGCGACGCIEAYASGEGIKNQAERILDLFLKNSKAFKKFNDFEAIRTRGAYNLYEITHSSRLKSLYIDGKDIDAKTIFDFANLNKMKDAKDEFAYYLIEVAAERFAKVLFSLSNIHGIERFGIGGSVAINNPCYLDIVRNKMKTLRSSEDIFKSSVEIEVSPLGEYVTDYGALLLVVNTVYKKNWIDTIIKLQHHNKK